MTEQLTPQTVGDLMAALREFDRWGNYGGPWTLVREGGDPKEVQEAVIVGRVEDSELGWPDGS